MNAPRVSGIDEYEGQLLHRSVVGNLLVYLTEGELCLLRVGGPSRRESIRLKGRNFLGFAVSARGYVALLDHRSVEVRRVDALGELLHRFGNIAMASQGYPRLRWDQDQLYLIYPDRLEILDVSTRSRRGYTDIVVDYQGEQLAGLVIANIMDSERAVILQLKHRLVFSIIPTPVCDVETPLVNAVLTIHSPLQANDSRREYVIVLLGNKQLRVYNLLSLKQVGEVELRPKAGQALSIEADPAGESLLVRQSGPGTEARNVLYRVNSKYYQASSDYYSEDGPFFRYKFEVSIAEDLALFPTTVEECGGQLFDCFHFVFFKSGHVYSASQLVPHNFSQNPSELYLRGGTGSEMGEWKQLIAAYMRLSNTEIPRDQRHLLFPQQERKAFQYEAIKADFDSIVARFTECIHEQSRRGAVSEQSIQEQWNLYLAQVAKERKFTLETMSLFKIESQVVKNETPQQLGVSKELECCVKDLEGREGRIDARIKERKKEMEGEKREREREKDKDKEKKKEKQTGKETGVTNEELQRYQQDYQKFVAEFMMQSQRKEREENKGEPSKGIVLALPTLTEQEKRLIESASHSPSVDIPHEQQNERNEWLQMQQILNNVDEKIRGAAERLQPLVSRLSRLEMQGLERIKRNEEIVRGRCSASLQEIVKSCCKRMLSGLSGRVKKEMQTATREIYRLQDRNKAYYEESIERFKDFVKMQLYHRIDLYHRGRARLQQRVLEIAAEQH